MNKLERLPAPMGQFINRDKPVTFTFEGYFYHGYEGDTVASALMANGQKVLSRSFKYHRPRSVLTMAGQDANTLVQNGGEPNVLADRLPVKEGAIIKGQNYSGSLENDHNRILDKLGRFLPVGFYYRTFFKPLGSWDKWERIIRKSAGLGKLGLTAQKHYYDKVYLFHDVIVVGGGPAGLSAALKAAQTGADVLLVDENKQLGGSGTYCRYDDQQTAILNKLLNDVQAQPNIRILTDATCSGWFTDNYMSVIKDQRMYKVRAKQCILATGALEQHVVFRNNDLPGVMMCSAADRLMRQYGVKPGRRAVVLTGNDDGYQTALQMQDCDIDVAAIVDMRSGPQDADLHQEIQKRGISLMVDHTVFEAVPEEGHKGLKAVIVRKIEKDGEVAASGLEIDCDLLAMSAGYMPTYQLACQAGARLSYDDDRAKFTIDQLPKAMQVSGSVNGIYDFAKVLQDGERAALQALHNLGLWQGSVSDVSCDQQVNYPWPIFPHPKGREFVDFDEDLQIKDIINSTKMGYRDIQLVKRFSTVGMGPSQGRHSALPTARLVAKATGRTVTETGVTTARPPFAPEKLAHIAGRMFDPVRKTPMHDKHLKLGAKMMPAGNWQRPAYYGQPENRDEIIHTESLHVRNKVGLIDVSTLGGIELRGPDAAEFMNRMYTFAFLKMPVGKTRYAVMTNEHGIVIDDGVACRLSDNHFYVTATTGGVDQVYREMQKWNIQWRLNVDITNVTSAFAAVNLAGPDSRKVLEKLTDDIDLSPEGFPYLAYREGTVAGIPARLLRVGFVGELGYEIHVPARFGGALWDQLMEAGAHFDIKPFGVETQRLLRLEKGHIIIGQDTDAMSHPGELSLDWAIAKKKPFYLGGRSVKIVMSQQQTRKLIGFKLPKDGPKPEEGHLILSGDDISGNVTSCEYSPTVDHIIGLGFAGAHQAEIGTKIPIRVDDGVMVDAEVVAPHFFDPDNNRQEL